MLGLSLEHLPQSSTSLFRGLGFRGLMGLGLRVEFKVVFPI